MASHNEPTGKHVDTLPTHADGADSRLHFDERGGLIVVVKEYDGTDPASLAGGPGGSGTEYTEGDTDASITGTAVLWEDSSDTLRAVSSSKPLPVSVAAALPAGTNNIGDVDVLTLPALPAGNNNIGDVDVASLPALPAGNNNIGDVDAIQSGTWTVQPGNTANTTPWLVKESRSATATTTQVADTASSTTLLASSASRLGASIQNTSSAVLYVKCGTTASATDFSARLVQYSYFEVPFGYTGRIDGIWATDPGDGAAVITEYT